MTGYVKPILSAYGPQECKTLKPTSRTTNAAVSWPEDGLGNVDTKFHQHLEILHKLNESHELN